jgi:hypothetical protein
MLNKNRKGYSNGAHIFFTCSFSILNLIDHNANHTLDFTLPRVGNYFSLHFLKYSTHQDMFQIQVMNLSDFSILCYVTITCTKTSLEKYR